MCFNTKYMPQGSEYASTRAHDYNQIKNVKPRVYNSYAQQNDFQVFLKSKNISTDIQKAYSLWSKWGKSLPNSSKTIEWSFCYFWE